MKRVQTVTDWSWDLKTGSHNFILITQSLYLTYDEIMAKYNSDFYFIDHFQF